MSGAGNERMLRTRRLRKDYGSGGGLVRAVDEVDLDVAAGETLAVMGPSGCAAWAAMLDARHASALVRALGASARQVSAGLATAQVLPALPGALLGVPLGIGLFAATNKGGVVTVPSASWLAAAVLATLLVVAVLTTIPARVGARRPAGEVLRSEAA